MHAVIAANASGRQRLSVEDTGFARDAIAPGLLSGGELFPLRRRGQAQVEDQRPAAGPDAGKLSGGEQQMLALARALILT
jgi:ABC-type glutathione transport system ATPase component